MTNIEKPSILLVDDKIENLYVLTRILSDIDATLIEAECGNEALTKTLHHNFALILLDIQMPDIDGFEVARLLRADANTAHIPIIFITANHMDMDHIVTGYKAGAIDYIIKPVSSVILRSKVKVFLELHQYHQKQKELSTEKYRAMFYNSSTALFMFEKSPQGKFQIQECNNAAQKLLRLSMDEILSSSIDDLFETDKLLSVSKLLSQRTKKNITCRARVKNASSSMFNIDTSMFSFSLYEKQFLIIAARDISSDVLYEQELIKTKEDAAISNMMKDQFVANISHELRTPLNGIMGMTKLLQDISLDDTQKYYLKMLERSSEQLLSIVLDMLDFSQIDAGEDIIQFSNFNLNTLIDKIQYHFGHSLAEKNLQFFITKNSAYKDFWISSDERHIRQILYNLLSNAEKFTNTGSVSLHIHLEKASDAASLLIIHISDTGRGIDDQHHERIFESFYQIESTYTKTVGGIGLGLSLVKEILRQLKGNISLQSQVGKGSTFTVKIPVEKCSANAKNA